MRIISNNKTEDYNSFIEKKKGVENYNKIITSNSNQYNFSNNNIKINNNKIISYRSYNLVNNINKVKPFFNNKCWPNNNEDNKTLNLTNGKISIFNFDNSENYLNNSNINIFSLNSNANSNYFQNQLNNNYYNNYNYKIKNNFIDKDCLLNYLIKNISNPSCPSNIYTNDQYIKFNKIIEIYGDNLNTYVDNENLLKFANLKKYNFPIFFGFTLSGQSISNSKQFNRKNPNQIIKTYKTNPIYTNNWTINNLNFNNINDFSSEFNTIINPEFKYEIYDYFMQIYKNDNSCICSCQKKKH